MSEVILRAAVENDLEQMLEIYNHVILHTTAVFSYDPHTLSMRKEWFAAKKQANTPVIVAEIDGQIAGFCTYGPFRAWEGFKHTVENSIYVKDVFRGMGIASKLLSALIDAAKVQKVHTIIAGIEAQNTTSIALHKKFGFTETALLKEVGYKFNQWLDLAFLQLILH